MPEIRKSRTISKRISPYGRPQQQNPRSRYNSRVIASNTMKTRYKTGTVEQIISEPMLESDQQALTKFIENHVKINKNQ